jgi:hypothetical protein
MKKYALVFVTAALVLVGVGVNFAMDNSGRVDASLIQPIESKGLSSLVLSKGDQTIELINRSNLNQWVIKQNENPDVIAEATKIVTMLDSLNGAKILQEVTKKTEHYDRFEVSEEKATKLTIKTDGQRDLILYLGKTKDYGSQFVRKEGSEQVYLISKNLRPNLESQYWTYKKIRLDKAKVTSVNYQTKEKKKLKLDYDASKDELKLAGQPPKKKQLKKMNAFIDGLTTVEFQSLEEKSAVKNGKTLAKHSLVRGDKTVLEYSFIEKKKDKNGYLTVGFEGLDEAADPEVKYLASLADHHVFKLSSINESKFRKSFDDFFEEVKEKSKEDK